MTDSERDKWREGLVEQLRKAANNVELCRSHTLPEYLAGWEHRVMREAADEIERLNAECIRRMDAANVSFRQALANGEAADQMRRELER